ncbi:MAG: YaeQ family protein, partial [Vicinamibacteraceae bacterium]
MALTATIYRVSVELAHIDRGVYETIDLRLARHPSETLDYMATRLLAY